MGYGNGKGFYWGVDSSGRADRPPAIHGVKMTLWDWVIDKTGREPEFWGRYLDSRKDKRTGLTMEEANYIFKKSNYRCRILPIHGRNDFGSFNKGFDEGANAGERAINDAKKVGVPEDVWIYANIEPTYKCNSDWFKGWWKRMYYSPYGGGIYEDPAEAGNFNVPYTEALRYRPFMFSEQMYYGRTFVATDSDDEARFLWSQRPATHNFDHAKTVSGAFAPTEINSCRGMTVIWQYFTAKMDARVFPFQQFDMNLASQRGYDKMWNILSRK